MYTFLTVNGTLPRALFSHITNKEYLLWLIFENVRKVEQDL